MLTAFSLQDKSRFSLDDFSGDFIFNQSNGQIAYKTILTMWRQEILENKDLLTEGRKNWSAAELELLYKIYNEYGQELLPAFRKVIDTGCSSCRRAIIAGCYKALKIIENK